MDKLQEEQGGGGVTLKDLRTHRMDQDGQLHS